MRQLFSLPFLLAGALLITGCGKDKDETATPESSSGALNGGGNGGGGGGGGGGQTAAQLLVDRNYKLTASTVNPAYQGQTDLFANLPSCNTDDILRFASGGTWTLDEGASMCQQGGQQSYSGNWSLSSNNTVLNLSGAFSATYTVVTLDGTTLRLSGQQQGGDGQTYTITDTWTRQP